MIRLRPSSAFAVTLCVLMLSTSLAGCLEGREKASPVNLNVSLDSTTGEVVDARLADNSSDTANSHGATFTWDFSETFSGSGSMDTYWLEAGDGDRVEVSASDDDLISYTYGSHGVYRAVAGANDSAGNSQSQSFMLFVDESGYLNETGQSATTDPEIFWVDTTPGQGATEYTNEVDTVKRFSIQSTVRNPPNAFGFLEEDVTVTWTLFDANGDEVTSHSSQPLGADDEASWSFDSPSAPMRGGWSLEIPIDANENIEVWNEAHLYHTN